MAKEKLTNSDIKKLIERARNYNQKSTDIVNQVFDHFFNEGIDLREIPSNAYNADCLADAITCYVAYDEYDIDSIMTEISEMIKRQKE
jgi:hypothetical protein